MNPPKINRILQDKWVVGMDKEDLAQEMRIVIIKAAKGYKEGKGASFHTYLHRAMINRISTLITQASRKIVPESIDETYDSQGITPARIQEGLADPDDFRGLLELQNILNFSGMTPQESEFLKLKLEGLTMQEIAEEVQQLLDEGSIDAAIEKTKDVQEITQETDDRVLEVQEQIIEEEQKEQREDVQEGESEPVEAQEGVEEAEQPQEHATDTQEYSHENQDREHSDTDPIEIEDDVEPVVEVVSLEPEREEI